MREVGYGHIIHYHTVLENNVISVTICADLHLTQENILTYYLLNLH